MARSLLLRLEAPLQSWGSQGRFGVRETESEPTKSGVVGLLGAALGMRRDDTAMIAELASLEMTVRVDREGVVLRDYHTAGGGKFRGAEYGIWQPKEGSPGGQLGDTALTERLYLSDASFLVALGGDDKVIDDLAGALEAPRWPLFLGRKSCPPARPLLAGTSNLAPRAALGAHPFPGRLLAPRREPPERLRVVAETASGDPRQDLPISFELFHRRHGRRFVELAWIPRPPVEDAAP